MITKNQVLQALKYLPPEFPIDALLRELPMHSQNWHDEWNDIAAQFKPGTEISGQVVRKAPFGDFIEIGASEPALLEIVNIPGLTPDLYQLGEYNPLGSTIKAWVLGIPSRRTKQLRLTQDPSTDFDAIASMLPI